MTRVAAIDVGTNSVRLLVADPGDPLVTVERLMTITRLGKGVDASGHLDQGALARTLDCIAEYAAKAEQLGATRTRVTATSAIRDAADRDDFFGGVRARAGVDAEVLSGQDEARTAFLGAVASLDGEPPYLVLDIGGGSTELIAGATTPEAMTSRQLGCVRLTERCLHDDPPTREQLDEAAALVDAELAAAATAVDAGTATTLIGVAGTVTTVAALYLQLPAYLPERIHGTRVPLHAVGEVTEWLAGMSSAERAQLGPMARGREDVIVAGCLILQGAMRRLGFPNVLASEADILDGLALGLLRG